MKIGYGSIVTSQTSESQLQNDAECGNIQAEDVFQVEKRTGESLSRPMWVMKLIGVCVGAVMLTVSAIAYSSGRAPQSSPSASFSSAMQTVKPISIGKYTVGGTNVEGWLEPLSFYLSGLGNTTTLGCDAQVKGIADIENGDISIHFVDSTIMESEVEVQKMSYW